MEKRVALITGGSKGIARGIALDLASRGWSVALCYRSKPELAAETVRAIEAHGVEAMASQVDVSDTAASTAFVGEVEQRFGRIDALIHGAGPYHRVPLLQETPEAWRAMFDNNLHPVFDMSQAVATGMKERGFGRILGFSMANVDKMQANPGVAAHYIAKAGVLLLMKSLAKTLAPHGITANVISPGFIDSGSAPQEELDAMLKKIPAKRIGTVDDAVSAARFLLSEEASYVNGANIVISGAWGL